MSVIPKFNITYPMYLGVKEIEMVESEDRAVYATYDNGQRFQIGVADDYPLMLTVEGGLNVEVQDKVLVIDID